MYLGSIGRLALILIGFAAIGSCGESTPPSIPQTAVENGRQIYDRIKAGYPNTRLSIFGYGTPDPKVALWIPESDWNALSSQERISLGYYVKSHVPAIRDNPGPYLGISPNAPAYQGLVANCRNNMTDNSWMIGVGPFNAAGQLLADHDVAVGTSLPWRSNAPPP